MLHAIYDICFRFIYAETVTLCPSVEMYQISVCRVKSKYASSFGFLSKTVAKILQNFEYTKSRSIISDFFCKDTTKFHKQQTNCQTIYKHVPKPSFLIQNHDKETKLFAYMPEKQYFCRRKNFNTTTKMNEKGTILQELMARNFFAASSTRVAAELGINGKMVFTRLAQGTAGEKAIDRLWEQILYSYNLTDARLRMMPEILNLSDRLAANYRPEHLPEWLKHDVDALPELELLRRKDPLAYCFALTLFYAKALHLTPNTENGSNALIETIQQVDALLQRHFPDAQTAHLVAVDTISQAREVHIHGWCHLMNMVGRVICYYAYPLYMDEQTTGDFCMQPWSGMKWWTAKHGGKTTLWVMDPNEEGVAIYHTLQIPVQPDRAPVLKDIIYQRWGFIAQYDMVRVMSLENGKLVRHGYYEYRIDETQNELSLRPIPQMPSRHPWTLPKTMQSAKESPVWSGWIKQYSALINEWLLSKLAEAMGQEETDYEVKNVTMSRSQCVLTISAPNERPQTVALSIDKHPVLRNVSVWDEVVIMRGIADGKLYACWENNIMVDVS